MDIAQCGNLQTQSASPPAPLVTADPARLWPGDGQSLGTVCKGSELQVLPCLLRAFLQYPAVQSP